MSNAKTAFVSYWLRRFLEEYLVTERNLSENTRKSYRDTFKQILPYISKSTSVKTDMLLITHISDTLVKDFLIHIEQDNGCSIATRNQRLSAVHAFARYVSDHCPEYLEWCRLLSMIPVKRNKANLAGSEISEGLVYLDKVEMNAILNAPDTMTLQGKRDHALLLFLYNSGARASEAASLTIDNLRICMPGVKPTVIIYGKGGKRRVCPLWDSTVAELIPLISGRKGDGYVFLNRYGNQITRAGLFDVVKKYAAIAEETQTSLKKKRVSPHTIRHTTASHLLEAGVDINTIRAWLGHVSVDTTNIYAEVNIKMKAEALEKCEVTSIPKQQKAWKNEDIMKFLSSI